MAKRDNGKTAGIDPIFISVKEAAAALADTAWNITKLCDNGTLRTETRRGHRLILADSLRAYVAGGPR